MLESSRCKNRVTSEEDEEHSSKLLYQPQEKVKVILNECAYPQFDSWQVNICKYPWRCHLLIFNTCLLHLHHPITNPCFCRWCWSMRVQQFSCCTESLYYISVKSIRPCPIHFISILITIGMYWTIINDMCMGGKNPYKTALLLLLLWQLYVVCQLNE